VGVEGRLVLRLRDLLWHRRGDWSAKVVAVHVEPGDRVEQGQVILEVEVDKAVIEVESPASGVVVAVHVEPGQEVGPDAPLLELAPA